MKLHPLTFAILSSLVAAPLWAGEEAELAPITVEGKKLTDVSGEEVKSADLAEALSKEVPDISIVRRSGIANDIILRGQKKDNINILIDGAKVYGACPNRMDPPTSHIVTHNIDSIEITEGPYDVENFGTLSGAVKITTKKPEKGFAGEVNLNLGRWGYRKASTTLKGGTDRFKALVTLSGETSEQYEDGDGNNFPQQIENFFGTSDTPRQYKDRYLDQDAYTKRSFMGKFYLDVTDDQELQMSYTANRSDDVLYPTTPMDALYDNSDILDLNYKIKHLGALSKSLEIQYYHSRVEHPMSTFFRKASGPVDSENEKRNSLEAKIQGLKLTNAFDLNPTTEITYGIDLSRRNWDGHYEGLGKQAPIDGLVSIDDTDTDNRAVFFVWDQDFSDFNLRAGARYDDTSIEPGGKAANQPSNDYYALSGYLFGTYQAGQSSKLFAGIGRSHRVPDARELYFRGSNIINKKPVNPQIGSPDLDQTSNTEIDLGMESEYQDLNLKTKLFYSWLQDYIYFNSDKKVHKFENIDAVIYGLDISGSYFMTDDLYADFGLAWLRGKKDKPLAGQSDTDLAEIPPLKFNLALNYDYMYNSSARAELVAADTWDKFDADNGEQKIGAWAVLNLKVKHYVNRRFEITAGVDNLFDRTYAVSNTYKDLTLLSATGGDDVVMLLNEPGRYYYVNTTFKF